MPDAAEQIYDEQAENALIGACLTDPPMARKCRELLRDDDIHDLRLRWIWQSICAIDQRGAFPDVVNVTAELEKSKRLNEVGGAVFLAGLFSYVGNSQNATDYARIVARDGTRRRILRRVNDIVKMAFEPDRQIDDLLSFSQNAFAGVDHNHRPNISQRFTIRDSQDALEPQPPIDWIIDKLFQPASVNVIVGEPGSKKTYAMIDAAVCVAAGLEWLGMKTQKRNVLIVDEESGPRRLAMRLGNCLRGHYATLENCPVYYVSISLLNLRDAKECESLTELIETTNAGLVVIDALADVMPGADENAVNEVHPVFLSLRQVAEKTQSAIVIIHHTNKTGSYRGSSAIKGAVDLMLTVESSNQSPVIRFGFEKSRDVEPFNFSAIANFPDGQFFLTPAEEFDCKRQSQAQEYVLRFLAKGQASIDDIMAGADVCSENSARKAVFELAKMGKICRVDAGAHGGRGIKAVYRMGDSLSKKSTQ